MTHPFRRLARKSEGRSVAVEAAVCMGFILLPMLAFVLLFGRYFWYHKIAHMAGAPLSEIKNNKGTGELASNIIAWKIGDVDADTSATLMPTALCGTEGVPGVAIVSMNYVGH